MTFYFLVGLFIYFVFRCVVSGFFTVDQNERAVVVSFGRAQRVGNKTTLDDPISLTLKPDEKERYQYPQLRVIGPGGPYFKWPWQRVQKVSVATETVSMAFDPEDPRMNNGGQTLEAVTRDQLNIGLTGQIRFRVCEQNIYAYLFGVKQPDISKMLRGDFRQFSVERLLRFLVALGQDVDIVVKPHKDARKAAALRVLDASVPEVVA